MAGKPLLIGDRRFVTRATREVVNPFNGDVVGEICFGGSEEVQHALAAAETASYQTRRQAPFERAAVLNRAADLIRANAPGLASLMVSESGKPIALAEVEVQRCALTFALAAAETLTLASFGVNAAAGAAGRGYDATFHRFPLGVILAITPFNFPLNLVAHKIAPAIATGNTVILKPSPRTPFCALRLTELLLEAGMIPGQVNCVNFDPELVPGILADGRVKMLTFTGSDKVGWQLKAQAVKQKVTLELGGNAAAIVHSDADLARAVPLLAAGAFNYAGQTCISAQRLFVQQGIYEEFKTAFVAHVREKVKHGDPRERDVVIGPMIDRGARDRVLAWVDEALKAGAKLLTDLRVGADDTVIPAIVLDGLPPGTKIACAEVFGPVVALAPYGDFEEAISRVNASDFGLQAGVFTQDIGRIHHAFRDLEVGAVIVNNGPTFRTENMPYGGVKDSGLGREGVRSAMEDMTELRGLVINLGS